jgi:DNA repair protein RadA
VDESFEFARAKMKERYPVRMIIVDSLTSNFRAEYCGRENLPERQQALLKHMNSLYRFSEEFDAAAIVTNQVQSNPGVFFGDPLKPIGGNIVGHTSKSRISLRKSKKGSRVAKLVDSPDRPDGEAPFYIWTDGIVPFDWGPDKGSESIEEDE